MSSTREAPVGAREAPAGRRPAGTATALLFTCTSFSAAALLFLVQPMIAKLLLPLFGGSPSVWNTSNLYFQVSLLAGYLVTHLTVARLGVRRQSVLQVVLVLLPLLALPVGLPASTDAPDGVPTVLWLLTLLAVAVGAPFLLLSTVGPLLQRWFGATTHPRAADPYFLFAAGNTGSLLALLGYPALVEPRLTLDEQLRLWSWGYLALVVLLVGCAVAVHRTSAPEPVGPAGRATGERLDRRRQLQWVLLAALASSFMLGTTTHLSTDLTPIPLLWVVPLALYLTTFIVAFALSRDAAAQLSRRLAVLLPALVVPVVLGAVGTTLPLVVQVLSHLALFTAVALVAHARLAAQRPGVERLTAFYLLLAVGGALGGAVNALLGPVLLDRSYEYPLAIAAAVLLVPGSAGPRTWLERRYGVLGTVLLVVAGIAALPAVRLLRAVPALGSGLLLLLVTVLLMVVLGRIGARSPRPYAAGLVLVLVLPLLLSPTLRTTRTFFGVQSVVERDGIHSLQHGSTVHGSQDLRPGREREPRSYYHRDGPAGDLFATAVAGARGAELGFVGLGTGALAAYGRAGQSVTFFEIDPATVDIASDPRLFRYLSDSEAEVDVVVGDGRLSLADQPAGRFDVLVLDAFSSDAIPVHLLTREAVELYVSRLAEDGLLAFHISNRYLDLGPVLADIAEAEGLSGSIYRDPRSNSATGKLASSWVVLGRDDAALAGLDGWDDLASLRRGESPWTDDFSHVLGALI